MFSFFKKKKAPQLEFPPFPEEIRSMMNGTVNWCHSQIGKFLNDVPQTFPARYGLQEDIMIGSYVCGFVQGQFLTNGHLERWSRGDHGLYSLGFSALVMPSLAEILGDMDRSIDACKHLPQLGPDGGSLRISQIDEMGGSDGIDHAKGNEKQHGGLLEFYLRHNVQR